MGEGEREGEGESIILAFYCGRLNQAVCENIMFVLNTMHLFCLFVCLDTCWGHFLTIIAGVDLHFLAWIWTVCMPDPGIEPGSPQC